MSQRLKAFVGVVGIALLCLGALPVAAFADDPELSQELIYSEDFESSLGPEWDLTPHILIPPSTAWWGRKNQVSLSGTWSLWCAAGGGNHWPSYPSGSAGPAILSIPNHSDYYSTTLSTYYSMPSLGVADSASFSVAWRRDGALIGESHADFPKTGNDQWNQLSYDISDPSGHNMSRSDGVVIADWIDVFEGPGQFPTTGQGASIDDLEIHAYTYGPVRSLTASETASSVVLDWEKPYRATGSTTVEERSVAYRVWRAPGTSAPFTWTELTGARITSTDFTDSTGDPGVPYTYLVQTWVPVTGVAYSDVRTVVGGYGDVPTPGIMITKAADASVVLAGTTVTYTYTVQNTGDTSLADIEITDNRLGAVATIASLAPGASTIRQASTVLNSTTTNIGTATGTYGTFGTDFYGQVTDDSNAVQVQVRRPQLTLNKTVDDSTVSPGTTVTYGFSVKNTGNVRLTNVQVTDPDIGYTSPSFTLDPGETRNDLTATEKIDVTFKNTATATGYYSAFDTWVNDKDAVTVSVSSDSGIERIAGATRVETAVEISKKAFPNGGADTVVIATAYGWADALPAAALCGAVDGPLLLVDKNALPSAVRSEIMRLGASKAYIVGGPAVVSGSVASAIDAIPGMSTPKRLGGAHRYATAELVGREVKAVNGGASPSTVFVATGLNFPDALAASSLAAAGEWPILLTERNSLPSSTRAALSALQPSRIVVCGDVGVVSSSVASQLGAYGTVIRKGGVDRFATADLIVRWGETALSTPAPNGMYVATGRNYPDALAGGPLGGGVGETGEWRPLVLTEPDSLSPKVATYMSQNPSITYVGILGGSGPVSTKVESQLRARLP